MGGPSIIFNIHHKAEETLIHINQEKKCGSIHGFDANLLYLWSIKQYMHTLDYTRLQR